ncbi:hypothetical protein, partial [Klenkia sp. PcliD-1-E]|uniref:hypothetical protein n=1 Tax=Klenkia sp. PcliD-1-E TaxID=2954492 RepID=UPI0020968F6F
AGGGPADLVGLTPALAGEMLAGAGREDVAPAAALAATVLAAVVPPGRFAALVVCLPVGALLAGALVQGLLAAPALRRARPVLLGVGAAGLVAALVAATVLVRTGPADDFGARDRADLVAWLRAEVPPGTPVAADGLLAQELARAGVPLGEGGLRVSRGAAPPGMTGLVVARFGDAASGLVVADPQRRGPDAEERRLRRELSAALLTNPTTADAGQATGTLLSGDVDPRLLTLLAGVASQHGVGISALPAVPGEVAVPVRHAVVDSVGGVRLADDPALTGQVEGWLAAQLPPYSPDEVVVVPDGLRVGYRYAPDPDALVAEASG